MNKNYCLFLWQEYFLSSCVSNPQIKFICAKKIQKNAEIYAVHLFFRYFFSEKCHETADTDLRQPHSYQKVSMMSKYSQKIFFYGDAYIRHISIAFFRFSRFVDYQFLIFPYFLAEIYLFFWTFCRITCFIQV